MCILRLDHSLIIHEAEALILSPSLVVSFPDPALKRGKGSVTVERFLGCAESAVSFFGKPEEVGSYVTSLQFLLSQQYVHRRECMSKNKDVATTKQNEGQGCFVSKQVYLRQKTA